MYTSQSNVRNNTSDSLTIGWISIAELFLLVGIMMIAVSALLDQNLHVSSMQNVVDTGEITSLNEQLNSKQKAIDQHELTIVQKERLLSKKDTQIDMLTKDVAEETNEKEKAIAKLEIEKAIRQEVEMARDTAEQAKEKAETENAKLKANKENVERARDTAEQAKEKAETENAELKFDKEKAEMATVEALKAKKEADEKLAELGDLYDEAVAAVKEYKEKVGGLEFILAERDQQLLNPLANERLVITLFCRNLPNELDLDLYVQDPENRLCDWRSPRILKGLSETAIIILSEDLKRVRRSSDEQDAKSGQKEEITEEKYYATELLGDRPYLIFGMLRKEGGEPGLVKLEDPIEVHWRIEVKNADDSTATENGVRLFEHSGAIVFDSTGYVFPGLRPICGFTWSEGSIAQLKYPDLPKTFRGWTNREADSDAKGVLKIREQRR